MTQVKPSNKRRVTSSDLLFVGLGVMLVGIACLVVYELIEFAKNSAT